MDNAIHQPQTVLVLGGGSEIARAIVEALASPVLRTVILAARRPEEITLPSVPDHVELVTVAFDATNTASHGALIDGLATAHGDLDVVVQAFGQLGAAAADDPALAAEVAATNYVGAVTTGLAVAGQLRRQGHGTLVVLSSVAGVRTRASNFVYGSTKAGQDGFATGLGDALHGSGASVMVVRPGYVRTAMSAEVDEAPFAVDAEDVAVAVVEGLRKGRSVVWVPGVLRYVFGVLRVAPGAVWRRLDR